jgi:hypothetical protein
LTVDNGMTNSAQTTDITTYNYAYGLWDNTSREFRGFGRVDTVEPNGTKTRNFFKQTDALKARLYEQTASDSASFPYAKTEDVWNTSTSNGVYTDTLATEKNYTYDGATSSAKTIQTDYQYDSYGNVTKKSELGDTGTSSDNRYTYNEYTTDTTDWIVNTLKHTYTNASDDSTKVSENWRYYDGHSSVDDAPTKGDLTKVTRWLSGGSNPSTTFTYDSYGNKTQGQTQTATAAHGVTGALTRHIPTPIA